MDRSVNLFLDFDEVINVEGIANPKNRGKLPPLDQRFEGLKHGFVHISENGLIQRFNVSHHTEVIDFINDLAENRGVNVMWLSTWERYASQKLNPYLGTNFRHVPWTPDIDRSPEYMTAAKLGSAERDAFVEGVRNQRKLDQVKKVTASSGRPFIWIDDSATRLYQATDFDVPSLAVTPNPLYGIDRGDAQAVTDFLDELDSA